MVTPAATVFTAGVLPAFAGSRGSRVRQAMMPSERTGGISDAHVHPACASTQLKNMKSGINARTTLRATGFIASSLAHSSAWLGNTRQAQAGREEAR
ncbi:hypothetical protein [Sorangium sp. So ce131]|uniref:hypothetical protein n=1 Tax=Sorangium sp. So ce131 TaxID=3133282 RepID=UPI003F641EEB